jgi:hypothetical protein
LTASLALLMQHQRPTDGTNIVAAEEDFAIAVELLSHVIGHASDDLSANARDVLALIQAEKLTVFDINVLKSMRPEWTRHKFRAALDELLGLEVIASPRRGRPRRYEVIAPAIETLAAPAIRLLPPAETGELPISDSNDLTNSCRMTATG